MVSHILPSCNLSNYDRYLKALSSSPSSPKVPKSPMKDEDYKMYGEYANIVGFVAGNVQEEDCTNRNDLESDFDFGLAHLEEGHGSQNKSRQTPKRDTISAAMQSDNTDSFLLVLGQPPFHIEFVSTTWANKFGWSSEEIMGLDLRFMQGDGAIGINIRTLYDVAYTEKEKSSEVSGYNKDGTIFTCKINCTPIYDTERVQFSRVLSNIAIEFTDLKIFPDFPSQLLEYGSLNEIGMPLDRRENCTSYRSASVVSSNNKSFASEEFAVASNILAKKSLSDVVRFMSTSETSTAMALTDRNGRLVSINQSFSNLFGVTIKGVQGLGFEFLFNDLTDVYTRQQFPSATTQPYQTPLQPIEKRSPKSKTRDYDKHTGEFTAVLYDSRQKTVTCRVVIVPIALSLVDVKQTGTIHFGVCIQKLFIEETCQNRSISKRIKEDPRFDLILLQSKNMKRLPLAPPSTPEPYPEPFMDPFSGPEFFPMRDDILRELEAGINEITNIMGITETLGITNTMGMTEIMQGA